MGTGTFCRFGLFILYDCLPLVEWHIEAGSVFYATDTEKTIKKSNSSPGLSGGRIGVLIQRLLSDLFLEYVQIPLGIPGNAHFLVFTNYEWKPDIAAVCQIFLFPHVEAGNEFILVFTSLYGNDVSALSIECLVRIKSCSGISKYFPFAHDRVCHSQFGLVGIPSRTTA